MTSENHVYFLRTGSEASSFVPVRLFSENGTTQAEASIAGPATEGAEFDEGPIVGDPSAVLRDAREKAGLTGLDLRVELDGVEWDPDLGALVDQQL